MSLRASFTVCCADHKRRSFSSKHGRKTYPLNPAGANHGVSERVVEEHWLQNRAFFSLPVKDKLSILADSNNRYYCILHYKGACSHVHRTFQFNFKYSQYVIHSKAIWGCRGYTPMAEETLDPDHQSQGDTKEGTLASTSMHNCLHSLHKFCMQVATFTCKCICWQHALFVLHTPYIVCIKSMFPPYASIGAHCSTISSSMHKFS